MIYNNVIAREVAEYLLEIKAVVLKPEEPFTWASGLKSPIYCDNRKTLSYSKVRTYIKTAFAEIISEEFGNCDVIAGVATAGIPHGALVADVLNKPFVYVRDKAKGHGMENLIEGKLDAGQKVVVIEDLISTGGSSLKAVNALREARAEVLGLGAIFTYGFPKAETAFAEANCKYFTLSEYPTLLDVAIKQDYIKPEEKETLLSWYQDPAAWSASKV
ncbi:MAG TPA: orotate phosphoribosyltransferase [Chitinophagales bacterium]|nr:orotate phosphoribosyltransferase [Chitinophagales bacterium]